MLQNHNKCTVIFFISVAFFFVCDLDFLVCTFVFFKLVFIDLHSSK